MRPLARRMGRLGTETAFEVLARARALEAKGRNIVHLEIGEPDFDSPRSVVAAGVASIERGETHYTPSAGIPELREAVAGYLNRARGLHVEPAQVRSETAFEVLARARALEAKGRNIVHLEIGEPDFDSPRSVVAAGVASIERGETHYTPSAGIPELREAVAGYLNRARGLHVEPAQV